MAEPKKKLSHSRSGARRSQLHMHEQILIACKQCKTPKMPHVVCAICGSFNGEKVLDMDKKDKKVKTEEETSAK